MTAKATNKTEEVKVEKEFKECFIITPIGSIGSEIFNKTEGLINSVLKPVLEKFNFIPIPAHHINDSGSINKQIIEKIVNCELVIANLTSINPNVMYELAIRHSFGKKVITMAENGTKLPFDIVDQRTIFYEDSMIGVEKVKPLLDKAIYSCLNGKDKDEIVSNPIYDAINQYAAIKNLPTEQQDGFSLIMDRLDKIEIKVSNSDLSISKDGNNYSYNWLEVKVTTDVKEIEFYKIVTDMLVRNKIENGIHGGMQTIRSNSDSSNSEKRVHSFKIKINNYTNLHSLLLQELNKLGFYEVKFKYY